MLPRTQNDSKGTLNETTTGQIAPFLPPGQLDVGFGIRIQPSNNRGGIFRFEIQNDSE